MWSNIAILHITKRKQRALYLYQYTAVEVLLWNYNITICFQSYALIPLGTPYLFEKNEMDHFIERSLVFKTINGERFY